jgi:hypothetical protein
VLGRVEEARRLLERAIEVGGEHGDELKLQALEDPDLQALWQSETSAQLAECFCQRKVAAPNEAPIPFLPFGRTLCFHRSSRAEGVQT